VTATVVAVARDGRHRFSKRPQEAITLVAGFGVEGDSHAGATVQHRSRVRATPHAPNLRQVHLIGIELLDELVQRGFAVGPGDIGENVTTRGVDLLALPTGARLRLGEHAVVEVTGLRNPCVQLDRFRDGLRAALLDRDDDGNLIRRAGVMSVVIAGGEVRPGDAVTVELPTGVHRPLQPV
jgi:MOSC domain-containing protein YiiM